MSRDLLLQGLVGQILHRSCDTTLSSIILRCKASEADRVFEGSASSVARAALGLQDTVAELSGLALQAALGQLIYSRVIDLASMQIQIDINHPVNVTLKGSAVDIALVVARMNITKFTEYFESGLNFSSLIEYGRYVYEPRGFEHSDNVLDDLERLLSIPQVRRFESFHCSVGAFIAVKTDWVSPDSMGVMLKHGLSLQEHMEEYCESVGTKLVSKAVSDKNWVLAQFLANEGACLNKKSCDEFVEELHDRCWKNRREYKRFLMRGAHASRSLVRADIQTVRDLRRDLCRLFAFGPEAMQAFVDYVPFEAEDDWGQWEESTDSSHSGTDYSDYDEHGHPGRCRVRSLPSCNMPSVALLMLIDTVISKSRILSLCHKALVTYFGSGMENVVYNVLLMLSGPSASLMLPSQSRLPRQHIDFLQRLVGLPASQVSFKFAAERPISEHSSLIESTTSAGVVIEECNHDELAAAPDDADGQIEEVRWAQHVERLTQSSNLTEPTNSADEAEQWIEEEDTHQPSNGGPRELERVFIVSFNRCGKHLSEALQHGTELETVRAAMHQQGHSCKLPSGASVFVYPKQYNSIRALLPDAKLRAHHAVVAEAFWPLICDECRKLPRKLGIRPSASRMFAFVDGDGDEVFTVERTFINTSPRRIMNWDAVTHSTSDVHGVMNSRRYYVADGF